MDKLLATRSVLTLTLSQSEKGRRSGGSYLTAPSTERLALSSLS
jgi:hypothetical protein